MREIIAGKLWLGNAVVMRDIRHVLAHGVEAIIDVAADEPILSKLPRDVIYCRFPLVDGGGNDPLIIRSAVETTASFVRNSKPTVVFCSAGLSRSPCVVAAAVAMTQGDDPHARLEEVASTGPSEVSPLLWADIVNACLRRDA